MSETEVKPAFINDLVKFEASALKHVEVPDKAVLPSKEDIETEKKHLNLVNGVESFDKNKLKRTVTQEKSILPDKEEIEREKKNKAESEI